MQRLVFVLFVASVHADIIFLGYNASMSAISLTHDLGRRPLITSFAGERAAAWSLIHDIGGTRFATVLEGVRVKSVDALHGTVRTFALDDGQRWVAGAALERDSDEALVVLVIDALGKFWLKRLSPTNGAPLSDDLPLANTRVAAITGALAGMTSTIGIRVLFVGLDHDRKPRLILHDSDDSQSTDWSCPLSGKLLAVGFGTDGTSVHVVDLVTGVTVRRRTLTISDCTWIGDSTEAPLPSAVLVGRVKVDRAGTVVALRRGSPMPLLHGSGAVDADVGTVAAIASLEMAPSVPSVLKPESHEGFNSITVQVLGSGFRNLSSHLCRFVPPDTSSSSAPVETVATFVSPSELLCVTPNVDSPRHYAVQIWDVVYHRWVPDPSPLSFGAATSACPRGMRWNLTAHSCRPFNECLITRAHNCLAGVAWCEDTDDSFTCHCNDGYVGDGSTQCVNINECATTNGGCDPHTECTDKDPPEKRECGPCPRPQFFVGNGSSPCVNANECQDGTHNCAPDALCTDTFGSFACACKAGFNGNGTTCVPSFCFPPSSGATSWLVAEQAANLRWGFGSPGERLVFFTEPGGMKMGDAIGEFTWKPSETGHPPGEYTIHAAREDGTLVGMSGPGSVHIVHGATTPLGREPNIATTTLPAAISGVSKLERSLSLCMLEQEVAQTLGIDVYRVQLSEDVARGPRRNRRADSGVLFRIIEDFQSTQPTDPKALLVEYSRITGIAVGACGDGLRVESEVCDDGNSNNGDGCSEVCKLEPGFSCTRPSVGEPDKCDVLADFTILLVALVGAVIGFYGVFIVIPTTKHRFPEEQGTRARRICKSCWVACSSVCKSCLGVIDFVTDVVFMFELLHRGMYDYFALACTAVFLSLLVGMVGTLVLVWHINHEHFGNQPLAQPKREGENQTMEKEEEKEEKEEDKVYNRKLILLIVTGLGGNVGDSFGVLEPDSPCRLLIVGCQPFSTPLRLDMPDNRGHKLFQKFTAGFEVGNFVVEDCLEVALEIWILTEQRVSLSQQSMTFWISLLLTLISFVNVLKTGFNHLCCGQGDRAVCCGAGDAADDVECGDSSAAVTAPTAVSSMQTSATDPGSHSSPHPRRTPHDSDLHHTIGTASGEGDDACRETTHPVTSDTSTPSQDARRNLSLPVSENPTSSPKRRSRKSKKPKATVYPLPALILAKTGSSSYEPSHATTAVSHNRDEPHDDCP